MRSQKGGKFVNIFNALKNTISKQRRTISIESYDLHLPQLKVENVQCTMNEAAVTPDLAKIPIPVLYEHTNFDAFGMQRIDSSIEDEKDKFPLTKTVFEPFTSIGVEGCEFENLSSSVRKSAKFLTIGPKDPGFEGTVGARLNSFHLALPYLYPHPFDYEMLLDFPEGKTLYPFQRDGVSFLIERANALLADEMGLGKSIQAITAARLLFETKIVRTCLIVCPKSVLVDWAGKFEEWAPELQLVMICGPTSSRQKLWEDSSQVFLVTYDTLREDVLNGHDAEADPLRFDLVILDEIQKIKNSSTKSFRAVSQIGGIIRWGLSGTPLENRLEELITIFNYLTPGLFKRNDITDPQLVQSIIKPFILRRTKSVVLKNLPEKIHERILLDLEPHQRAAYALAEQQGIIHLKEKGQTATVTHIMALISQLKQICNIELLSGESSKFDYVLDLLGKLTETGEKVVIFSQYPEKTLRLLIPKLMQFNPLFYHGALTSRQREEVLTQFDEDANVTVLLISLKAGGLGLTLTAANYVIHFDSWWNPATMSQAEDRTHRIGQKKNVFVASLITRNTVEERIQKILDDKRHLFMEVVGEISDDGLTRLLTEKDLFGLFSIHRENT